MNNKITISLIIAVLAGFGGLLVWKSTHQQEETIDYGHLEPVAIQKGNNLNGGIGDHVRGKEDSKVVLVEYADFMCAGCAGATITVESLYEEYKDEVAFVFRHYPIQGHPNSRSAAAAAESAAMQGAFWPMIQALYLERNTWLDTSGIDRTNAYIEVFQHAKPDGDVEKFKNALGSPKIEQKINYDHELGGRNTPAVPGTPSFYVNGVLIEFDESIKTQGDIKNKIAKELDKQLAETAKENEE